MILDTLDHAARYFSLNPLLEQAFRALDQMDLIRLEPGCYEIAGEDIFLNLAHADLKPLPEAKLEVHNRYLDVQLLLEGEESFGWAPRSLLSAPEADFDAERDIQFFLDRPQTIYTLRPGQFTILLPEDAHAPLLGEGRVCKAILKVRM